MSHKPTKRRWIICLKLGDCGRAKQGTTSDFNFRCLQITAHKYWKAQSPESDSRETERLVNDRKREWKRKMVSKRISFELYKMCQNSKWYLTG